ncbi:MAG TPA: histidine kinase [Trebonia sp.]|nr:histidine kinase [Trebonia sp.]
MQAASPGGITAPARKNADGGRRRRAEAAVWLAAMAALIGAEITGQAQRGPSPYLGLDIAAGAVSLCLLPLLRRWPAAATLLLSLLAAVSPAATPPATMAILVVAEGQGFGVAVSVAAAGIAAHLVQGAWRPAAGLPYGWWAVLDVVAYAALVGWGTLVRAHRALISSLRERAEQAEAEQVRGVREARTAERARIAREMHDVLAHRLSLLATYAGALSYRPDAPPEQLSSAAEVVRSGIHQALDELREVIGVLRDDSLPDLAAGRPPLSCGVDLPWLIEESREAGMRVELSGEAWDALSGVPDAAGRTVFRIVQEGLTNARKHAAGEAVRVTLDGGPGRGLDVSVVSRLGPSSARARGAAAVPGTGTGLIGLAERVELAGGRLEYRRRDGEFRLHAWLPWPQDAGPEAAGPAAAGLGVTGLGVTGLGVTGAGPTGTGPGPTGAG